MDTEVFFTPTSSSLDRMCGFFICTAEATVLLRLDSGVFPSVTALRNTVECQGEAVKLGASGINYAIVFEKRKRMWKGVRTGADDDLNAA